MSLMLAHFTAGSEINLLYQHQTSYGMLQLLIKEKQWFIYIKELLMRMESLMHVNIADTYRDSLKSCIHVLQYWKISFTLNNLKLVGYLLAMQNK